MSPPGAGRREVSARASLGLWSPALCAIVIGGFLITGGRGVGGAFGVVLLLVGVALTALAVGAWLVVVDGVLHQRVLRLPLTRAGWLPPVDLRRLVAAQQRRQSSGRRGALVLTVRDADGVEREIHLAAWAPAGKVQRVIARHAKQCRVPIRESRASQN